MTKMDIASIMHAELGIKQITSKALVDSILNKLSETLQAGEDVKIPSFGNFTVRHKSARIGRNPRTGESAEISSRQVVVFRPSRQFKQALLDNDGA